jgi:hypothetical protein
MILAAIYAPSFFNLSDQNIMMRPQGINHPKRRSSHLPYGSRRRARQANKVEYIKIAMAGTVGIGKISWLFRKSGGAKQLPGSDSI